MGTKTTMLFVLLFIMHACMPRGNSAPIPSPPEEKVVMPDLRQLQKSENVAAGCKFDQFLSEATSSCDDCDTYCKDGKDSRDCPEQCYVYLHQVDLNRAISALKEKIQQLRGMLQKVNSTQRNIISEQEDQIQELSETKARLQKINSTQTQTISEQEDQIRELNEINLQLEATSSTLRNTISEQEDQIQELHKINERLERINATKGNSISKLEHQNQNLRTNNASQGKTISGLEIATGIIVFTIIIACAIKFLYRYFPRKQQKILNYESDTSIFEPGKDQHQDDVVVPLVQGNTDATEENTPVVPVQESEQGENSVQESEQHGGNFSREDEVEEVNVDTINEPCANDGCSKSPNDKQLESNKLMAKKSF